MLRGSTQRQCPALPRYLIKVCDPSLGHRPRHLPRPVLALGCWPHHGLPALFNSFLLICLLHKYVAFSGSRSSPDRSQRNDGWWLLSEASERGQTLCSLGWMLWAVFSTVCIALHIPCQWSKACPALHFWAIALRYVTKATWMLKVAEQVLSPSSRCVLTQNQQLPCQPWILLLGPDEFPLPSKLAEN